MLAKKTWRMLFYAFIFITYLVFGALVFQALEIENEKRERRATEALKGIFRQKYNISSQDWTQIETIFKDEHFRGNIPTWSFGNAITFTGSIITTVGYGNITPRTTAGRVVCILYALFGIPLTCLTLKSIGENLLDAIVAIMARIKQRIKQRIRERISCPETCTRHAIGRGPVLVLNVCLWLLTLVGLSILGQFRRSWTFLESLYFCFITFSTIGFGDYVPFPEGAMHEFADYVVMLLGVVLGFAVTSTMLCSLGSLFEESWQLPALPVLPARTVFDRFCHLFSFSIIPDKKVGALAPLETETQLAEDIRRKLNLTERTEVNKKKRISVG